MEILLVNRRGQIRRATYQGRNYLVAPATLIVPGVLNGSKGALYYPRNEVARNPGVWNNTPITVGHPVDPLSNLPITGRDPEVLDRVGIGYVFNDRIGKSGKRLAELWFDEERTLNYDRDNGSDIYTRVINGQPIELSTGLFTDNEPAHNGATDDKGRPYDYIARNYRPDHLAVLPYQQGACSVTDGCGVNVDNVNPNHDEQGRFASGEGGGGSSPVKDYSHIGHLLNGARVHGETDSKKSAMTEAKSLRSKGVFAGVIKDPKTGRHLITIPKSTPTMNRSFWRRMGEMLGLAWNQGRHLETGQYLNKTGVSPKQLNASAQAGYSHLHGPDNDEDEEVEDPTVCPKCGKVDCECANGMTGTDTPVGNSEETDMPLTGKQREEIVGLLTTNCECWKGKNGTAALNSFSDDELTAARKVYQDGVYNSLVANTLKKGVKVGHQMITVNAAKDGKLVVNAAKVDNADIPMTEQVGKEEEDTEEAPQVATAKGKAGVKTAGAVVGNQFTPEQLDQISRQMFGHPLAVVRSAVQNSLNGDTAEKQKLAELMTANEQDDEIKEKLIANHMKKDLEGLKLEARPFIRQRPTANTRPDPVYGAAPVTNRDRTRAEGDNDLVLELPTMNWKGDARE